MYHEVDIWNRGLSRLGELRLFLAEAKTGLTATAANPVVVTSTAHGYTTNDLVLLEGFTQMTQVNSRVFRVTVITANTYSLQGEDGSTYTAETTGGRGRKLLSPAGGAVGKHAYAVFDAWPKIRDEILRAHPWNCAIKSTRLARLQAQKTITAVTQANPAVVTSAAHGYVQGDQVLIENVVGMVELNDRFHTVGTVPTVNTFQLASEDSTLYTAYSSGGTAKKALTPLKPDFGWSARFDLPSDCLRMLEIKNDRQMPWAVEGREVYTDDGITVPIRYVRRLTDPLRFDTGLVDVLAARLMVEMCEELTQVNSKRELAAVLYREAWGRAVMQDGQEGSVNELAEDDWVLARL